MTTANRSAWRWGLTLIVLGVGLFVAHLCFGVPMGYSNGKDCCRAGCSTHPTIEDRIGCCAATCPSFSQECVLTCLGANPQSEVFAAISRAGRRLRGSDPSTPEQHSRSRGFLSSLAAIPQQEHMAYRLAAQAVLNDTVKD